MHSWPSQQQVSHRSHPILIVPVDVCSGMHKPIQKKGVVTLEEGSALLELCGSGQLGDEPLLDAVGLLGSLPHEMLQQQAVLDAHLPPPVCVC